MRPSLCAALFFLTAPAVFCPVSATAGDDPLLDGLSVLITTSSGDTTSTIPVLASDVELVGRLLLLGSDASVAVADRLDNAVRFQARRLAVLVRLLSHATNLVGETVNPADQQAVVQWFIARAGGMAAMDGILNRCGASRSDLDYWTANFLLASRQLDYLRDQSDMPSETELKIMFDKGNHRFGDMTWEEAADAYSTMVKNEKLQEALRLWLSGVLVQGGVVFSQ